MKTFKSSLKKFAYDSKQTVVRWWRPACARASLPQLPALRVLVLGIYLSDKKNCAHQVISELNRPSRHQISQRWIALGTGESSSAVLAVTSQRVLQKTPKFQLLNQMLSSTKCDDFDVIMVFDDDIVLPRHFLDNFLAAQYFCDFALCQPARNHNSWIDHPIVEQNKKMLARQTRFVEIGPVFSIRSDVFKVLLPFSELSPMGWGMDFVWPSLIEQQKKTMGIIDAVPIDHSLRKPFQHYDSNDVSVQQHVYLTKTEHLTPKEAFTVLKEFPLHARR